MPCNIVDNKSIPKTATAGASAGSILPSRRVLEGVLLLLLAVAAITATAGATTCHVLPSRGHGVVVGGSSSRICMLGNCNDQSNINHLRAVGLAILRLRHLTLPAPLLSIRLISWLRKRMALTRALNSNGKSAINHFYHS